MLIISSILDATKFAKEGKFDAYIAVGGGSVMDTCKAANLYASDPEAEFLDYVNAPIGKGKPVLVTVKPLIASKTLIFYCYTVFTSLITFVNNITCDMLNIFISCRAPIYLILTLYLCSYYVLRPFKFKIYVFVILLNYQYLYY